MVTRYLTPYVFKVTFSIVCWFFFSTLLSSVNKVLFGQNYNNFKFPLFVSSCHSGLHFVLAYLTIFHFAPQQFPRVHSASTNELPVVSFRDKTYWVKVVPCGLAGGIEISTCNAALMSISLSFYTIVKSTVPIWVLLFSFVLGLEQVKLRLIVIIFIICVGVALASISDVKFEILGFLLVLTGSVMAGFKWCLTQILLQKGSLGLDHPVLTLYVITPIMAMLMFSCSLVLEDIVEAFNLLFYTEVFYDYRGTQLPSLALIGIGSFAAFFMTLSEFMLIQLTSTLTLAIAGISKEVIMIAISVTLFKDPFSLTNYFGLVVSIFGISMYNYYKLTKPCGEYQSVELTESSIVSVTSPVSPNFPLSSVDLPNSN